MVKPGIDLPFEQITDFCKRWKISEPSLFGSVLRDDFRPDSDLDVLVKFTAEARWSLFELVTIENELSKILNRKVDLVECEAVISSPNYIRQKNILQNAQILYKA